MKKLLFISTLILATCLSAFAQDSGWKELSRKDYSIQYPANWDSDESGQMGTSFILFSPPSSAKDKFRENVNLLIQDLSGYDMDLDAYVELSESQIKTMVTDGKIIESVRNTAAPHHFQKMIYTGTQGIFKVKFEQYYWVIEDEAIILTLTCEAKEFKDFKDTGEKILNSFKLKLD